jgi:hypothetical protein
VSRAAIWKEVTVTVTDAHTPAVAELAEQNRELQAENRKLWSVVNELKDAVREMRKPSAPVAPELDPPQGLSRRRLLTAGTAGAVAAAAGVAIAKPGDVLAFSASGTPLTSDMSFEGSAARPPLDSSVVWSRQATADRSQGHTESLLSLIYESNQPHAFLWPLYVQVKGPITSGASQSSSQSAGAQVRAFNRGDGGTPWMVGFHSEAYHGTDDTGGGVARAANGTTILFNGELYRRVSNGRAIGLNLQSTAPSPFGQHGDEAINVQGDWQTGLNFEPGGSRSGTRGIWLQRPFDVGIDLADNCMRMNGYISGGGGSPGIFLEESRAISIRWNKTTQHIEFCWGSTVLCYVSLNRANVNLNP